MKHNKVQLFVLMGFLFIGLPLQGVKKAEKPAPSINQAEFWAIIRDIGSNPFVESFDELKNMLSKVDQGIRFTLLNSGYSHSESSVPLSPLDYAVLKENVILANYLVEQGANINQLADNRLQWLLEHQTTFADRAWLVSMFSNKNFANNLAINIIIQTTASKEDKILFIDTMLSKYAADLQPWCIQGLTYLRTLLVNPYYTNIDDINAQFRAPDQGSLLYGAISSGNLGFAYWLANHNAHVNDLIFYAAQPIVSLISYMCDVNLPDEEFSRCIKLLQLLIQKGANINLPGKDHFTATMLLESNLYRYGSDARMLTRFQRIWSAIKNPNDNTI